MQSSEKRKKPVWSSCISTLIMSLKPLLSAVWEGTMFLHKHTVMAFVLWFHCRLSFFSGLPLKVFLKWQSQLFFFFPVGLSDFLDLCKGRPCLLGSYSRMCLYGRWYKSLAVLLPNVNEYNRFSVLLYLFFIFKIQSLDIVGIMLVLVCYLSNTDNYAIVLFLTRSTVILLK